MFDVFQKYIREKITLTDEELELIRSVSIVKKLRKRQYLLEGGDVCHHNAFITKGCLRQYRLGEHDEEHIMRFAIENWWISDRESLTTGQPSKSYIDALEDSEVLLWSKENWAELLTKIPELHAFVDRLLAKSFSASQNRIHAIISYTAEEKYQNFQKSFPDIFSRVPLHMIASYLGISRETLSRIRHQLAHKQ